MLTFGNAVCKDSGERSWVGVTVINVRLQSSNATVIRSWHTPHTVAVGTKPVSVRMGNQGRIVVPAELRQALGIVSGAKLVARVEDGRLILETKESITAGLQKLFRDAVPKGVSLAGELIAERRVEARREEEPT